MMMTPERRRAAFGEWDAKVVSAYNDAVERVPCAVTLQGVHARDLVLVAADLAVRSSGSLKGSLSALDNARMRDAAVEVAVDRYLRMARPSDAHHDTRLVERILTALVYRSQDGARPALVRLTVGLPETIVDRLSTEIRRVLDDVDTGALDDWPGDLPADIQSCVIEAAIAEWMHERAESLGTAVGRDRDVRCARRASRRRGH
jgi:hypothetical protein